MPYADASDGDTSNFTILAMEKTSLMQTFIDDILTYLKMDILLYAGDLI